MRRSAERTALAEPDDVDPLIVLIPKRLAKRDTYSPSRLSLTITVTLPSRMTQPAIVEQLCHILKTNEPFDVENASYDALLW